MSDPPESPAPDVGDGLWQRVCDAVVAECGADKSLWNGQVLLLDPAKGWNGSSDNFGTVRLHDKRVVQPLLEMYATRGRPMTHAEQVRARAAMKTLVHEFGHLTAPAEHTLADRDAVMDRRDWVPIEEGVTEAWSYSRLDRVLDRVLPPDLAEQLKQVRTLQPYPAWAPAAHAFADKLGARLGLPCDEVLRLLNRQDRGTKAAVAADLLFQGSDLPGLVPAKDHAEVRERIRQSIDQGFAALLNLDKEASFEDVPAVSALRGGQIAEAAIATVREAEREYGLDPEVAKLRDVLNQQAPAAYAPTVQPGESALGRLGGRPPSAGRTHEPVTPGR